MYQYKIKDKKVEIHLLGCSCHARKLFSKNTIAI